MPQFHADRPDVARRTVVIHVFDQWTNARDSRIAATFCTCGFVPDPSQERGE